MIQQIKPNFFIVGAAKSGTTSLYSYLKTHPNIFIPETKEPHYFSKDYNLRYAVTDYQEYMNLFAPANPNDHKLIGEASVHYIHSSKALKEIYDFNADAKILVIMRNPIEMIYSYHAQMIYSGVEDEYVFSKAWDLQSQRAQGLHIPKGCYEPALLRYKWIASFGSQVENLQNIFPVHQIKYIFFDDLKSDVKIIYENILKFLEIPTDNRLEFPIVNQNKKLHNYWLNEFLRKPSTHKRLENIVSILHKLGLFSNSTHWEVLNSMIVWNTKIEKRDALSIETRQMLSSELRTEILKLGELTNRDLNHWL